MHRKIFNLTRQSSILFLILIVSAFVFASAAQAQDGTTSPDETTIAFLNSEDETIEVDYLDLMNGDASLDLVVVNKSAEPVTVSGEIILPGLKKVDTNGAKTFTDEGLFDTPKETIRPGKATVIRFELIEPINFTPADQVYEGFVIISDEKNGTAISKSILLTIKLQPQDEPAPASFEILNKDSFIFDYDKLGTGDAKEYVEIAVKNKGREDIQLTGNLHIPKVVAPSGQDIQLSFQMVVKNGDGQYQPQGSTTIPAGKIGMVTFELIQQAIEPAPGIYAGTISLMANDENQTAQTTQFDLAVPNANIEFEILGLSEDLSYDYTDLTSNRNTITIEIYNKSLIPLHLTGQVEIVDLVNQSEDFTDLEFRADPKKIPAQETGAITFKFIRLSQNLKAGTYSGVVLIAAQDGTTQTVPFKLNVPNAGYANSETIWDALSVFTQRIFERISNWLFQLNLKLDLVTFIAVIIAVVIVRHLVLRFQQRNHPGVVEIETIEEATGGKNVPVKALTAGMKNILQDLGLNPPNCQPKGISNPQIGSLITASGVTSPFLQLMSSVIDFINSWLPFSKKYTIGGTIRYSNGEYNLITEIKMREKTEDIVSINADRPEKAAEKTAYEIYRHVTQKSRIWNRIPEWARFNSQESFECYQNAINAGDRERALSAYQEATDLEINNALVRMPIGYILTEMGDYLGALEVYIKIILRWSDLLEPRYRLAALFSFETELWDQWEKLKKTAPKKISKLQILLTSFIETDGSTKNGDTIDDLTTKIKDDRRNLEEVFLELANRQWKYLRKLASWRRIYWRFLTHWDEHSYLRDKAQIWPGGIERRKFQRAVELGKYVTQLQIPPCHDDALQKGINLIEPKQWRFWRNTKWWGLDHYNAACFYSMAMEKCPSSDQCDQYALRGIEQLDKVVRDPENSDILNWMWEGDPDLEELRKNENYIRWEAIVRPEKTEGVPIQKAADGLAQGWELVLKATNSRIEQWRDRQKVFLQWGQLDPRHYSQIREWCQQESDVWKSLVEFSYEPLDQNSRQAFWNTVTKLQENADKYPSLKNTGNPNRYRTYHIRWQNLAKSAQDIHQHWDEFEDLLRHVIGPGSSGSIPGNEISDQIETAIETWESLNLWAQNPLEKSLQDAFMLS